MDARPLFLSFSSFFSAVALATLYRPGHDDTCPRSYVLFRWSVAVGCRSVKCDLRVQVATCLYLQVGNASAYYSAFRLNVRWRPAVLEFW